MRRVLTNVFVLGLLAIGLTLMILGISTMFGSRSMPSGDDASATLIYGFLGAAVGSIFILAAGFASRLSGPPGDKK